VRVFGFFGNGPGRRGPKTLNPEQQMNNSALQQEKVDEIVSKQDSRYDAMSEDEREKYYMKPSLMTKIKKALRVSSAIATLLVRASVLSYDWCARSTLRFTTTGSRDFSEALGNNSPPHPSTTLFADDQARFGEDPGVVRDGGLALAQRTLKGAAAHLDFAATSDNIRRRTGSLRAPKIEQCRWPRPRTTQWPSTGCNNSRRSRRW